MGDLRLGVRVPNVVRCSHGVGHRQVRSAHMEEKVIPGTRVRMSGDLKRLFLGNCDHKSAKEAEDCIKCSYGHVIEFGDCVGVVIGDAVRGFPEVDVRWEPSGLKYAYDPKHLVRA